MNLSEIVYPVYKLRNKPLESEGLLYYLSEYEKEDSIVRSFQILDDANVPGDSLAMRRLHLRSLGEPLKKINRAIFFLGDLIKLANPQTWFIDSNGKLFTYTKATRAKLRYHKVTKVIPMSTGGVVVEVEGISSRFKALFVPEIPNNQLYAGILHMGLSKILYGFYDDKYDDTWRMV